LRLLSVPALPVDVSDRLRAAWETYGETRAFLDDDLDCSVIEIDVPSGTMPRAMRATAAALRRSGAQRLFRFEAAGVAEEEEDRLSNALAEDLDVQLWIARRKVPASQWVSARPIEFGVDGFAVQSSPGLLRPGRAQERGTTSGNAALEFGEPLITLKAELLGVPASALARLRDAVGSERGGLLHVGAAPAISVRSGAPLLVLSCSDHAKSPLHRALDLIDIEARRFGGALGACAPLSSIPLPALLQTLAARIGLDAKTSQVIETNLPKPSR